MAISFDYPPGATPLDPDEAAGLIPSHITNHGQLNEWELVNIVEGERWAFSRKRKDLLSIEFVRRLHKRMFGDTWRWAGTFRSTEKNIGIDPARIQPTLLDLFKDAEMQLEHKSYSLDGIAARFSHRLVSIHPFANGNGRLSRTMADLLLVREGSQRFNWGAGTNPVAEGDTRRAYIDSLRAADARDYAPLLAFVRS
ncbi:MAG: mobile mystery protein B [Burkholderiales bacterium]|nr:mobile mystery protein B [Burkholderiales bacterium]MCJ7837741.1 mobile mystery protein B [Burkholderiales bacterium]